MNVLFVGAHHDDLEVSIGGSARRWANAGHGVYSAILTNSMWTAPDGTRHRDRQQIERYTQRAAKLLGYTQYSLALADCFELRYADAHVVALLELIRTRAIDTLVTLTPHDAHPDHRAASEIALNASRAVPRVLMTRVSWNSHPETFRARYFVDITDVVETKLEALKCYEDEYARTGSRWETFIKATGSLYGLEVGCAYAEGFEVLKFLECS